MLVIRGYRQPAPSATVLTIGNFDGVHLGHRALLAKLRECSRAFGLPGAVLSFEPHPREFFSPASAPERLSTLREKLELLGQEGVDLACLCRFNKAFASLSAEQFIEQVLVGCLRTRYLIIGDDFRFGARRAGDFNLLQEAGQRYGFRVEAMQSVIVDGGRVSSSAVREALSIGDMEAAARLLGRAYIIDGRVAHGDKIGRQLGFKTANIRVKHHPLPMKGVFAVEVQGVDGSEWRKGVANLGVRPTLGGLTPLLEVHLFDFERDIYGAHIAVRFVHKLRDEMRFPGLDALKAQIARDVQTAREFFQL